MHATCPTHLILFDFIIPIILGEEQNFVSFSLCRFLRDFVIVSLLYPDFSAVPCP
jgi:hypothetical protein